MGKKRKKRNINPSDFGSQQLVKDKDGKHLIRPVDGAKFHVVYPNQGQRYLQRIDDHILIVYRNRKILDPSNADNNARRYLAGSRIRELADRANINDRVTPNWDSFLVMVHSHHENIQVDKFDSYEALHRAMMHAVKFHNPIWKCCIADQKVGRDINKLRVGLDMLVEYFKIK